MRWFRIGKPMFSDQTVKKVQSNRDEGTKSGAIPRTADDENAVLRTNAAKRAGNYPFEQASLAKQKPAASAACEATGGLKCLCVEEMNVRGRITPTHDATVLTAMTLRGKPAHPPWPAA